ncbi:MAG: hypothetical protein IPP14_05845 [Planctomycetes bacterium]|nr:hypothetical protein [Planctomycetota bacterium]
MKRLPLVLIAVVLLVGSLVGSLVAAWIWNNPGDAPNQVGKRSVNNSASDGDQLRAVPTPAEAADQKMSELKTAQERLKHLEWVAAQDWAASNMPLLRKAIVADPDESVQIKAVEVALQLAGKEGKGGEAAVVKTALASSKGNTRARGLKAAREKPDASLVPTLLELVDNNDPYATMALNALAYSADERGKARITALAKDESCSPQLRQRAVALIAVTRDEQGHRYLSELANGENETLRRIAEEVLKSWNN